MKTAEEICKELGHYHSFTKEPYEMVVKAMKLYANQKLDEAAEKAKVSKLKLVHGKITKYVYVVSSQSIRSLKDKV